MQAERDRPDPAHTVYNKSRLGISEYDHYYGTHRCCFCDKIIYLTHCSGTLDLLVDEYFAQKTNGTELFFVADEERNRVRKELERAFGGGLLDYRQYLHDICLLYLSRPENAPILAAINAANTNNLAVPHKATHQFYPIDTNSNPSMRRYDNLCLYCGKSINSGNPGFAYTLKTHAMLDPYARKEYKHLHDSCYAALLEREEYHRQQLLVRQRNLSHYLRLDKAPEWELYNDKRIFIKNREWQAFRDALSAHGLTHEEKQDYAKWRSFLNKKKRTWDVETMRLYLTEGGGESDELDDYADDDRYKVTFKTEEEMQIEVANERLARLEEENRDRAKQLEATVAKRDTEARAREQAQREAEAKARFDMAMAAQKEEIRKASGFSMSPRVPVQLPGEVPVDSDEEEADEDDDDGDYGEGLYEYNHDYEYDYAPVDEPLFDENASYAQTSGTASSSSAGFTTDENPAFSIDSGLGDDDDDDEDGEMDVLFSRQEPAQEVDYESEKQGLLPGPAEKEPEKPAKKPGTTPSQVEPVTEEEFAAVQKLIDKETEATIRPSEANESTTSTSTTNVSNTTTSMSTTTSSSKRNSTLSQSTAKTTTRKSTRSTRG